MSNEIEIINPIPGGLRRTSQKRARCFIERGLACMEGEKLRFFEFAQREDYRQCGERQVYFWNGSRHGRTYGPGQVRS